MDLQRILLLVDLKPHETLDDLDDLQMIRTIGAFKSSFPGANIDVISISDLPKYAHSNQTFINDAYIIGHGDFSTLGSGLTVEECGQTFKEALLEPNFNINHIHLTCCHSAEKDILGSNKSLLLAVHENLSQVPDKNVLITGYRNQIHLVRTESLTCGEFKLNVDMPFAPVIHRGLQPLRIRNDCVTLTGYVYKDLIGLSNYCNTGKMPENPGPVFGMFLQFVTALQDTGKDGPVYKIAELDYEQKEKLEKLETSLNEFNSTNNIKIDNSTQLTDKLKGLDLSQLKVKFKELKEKQTEMNPEEFNIAFNQIYFACQNIKSNLKLAEGELFKNIRKALYKDLLNYMMEKTNCKGTRDEWKVKDFCDETVRRLKNIYFDTLEMDLDNKIQFSRDLDQMSVLYLKDTLDVHEFYLIDPNFEYTCQSNEKFPNIIFFSPTIHWEKEYWKDVLDDMQYFKDDEVEYGLKYICDAYTDFKYDGNEMAMNEILTELPVKLSAFLNKCDKKDDRLQHFHIIIALLDDNKEFLKQLDKKALMNWAQLLEHDLPDKKYLGSYMERVHIKILESINTCLQTMDTPKNTSFIMSSLAQASHTDIKSLSIKRESPKVEENTVTTGQTQPITNHPPINPNPNPQTQVTNNHITSSVETNNDSKNKFTR